MRDAKHLLFTPYGYYLRISVPKELRGLLGKREIKKSLSTFDYSHAIKVSRYLIFEIERVFLSLRGAEVGKNRKSNLLLGVIRRLPFPCIPVSGL